MKIEFLKEFLTIANLGSFSEAASHHFISQSSLSKHIKVLENELEVELFDRSTRSVVLSNYGEEILEQSKKICHLNDEIISTIHHIKSSKQELLKIASIPVMAQYNITGAITTFQIKHPNIQLSIIEEEGCRINDRLENKDAELAFQRVRLGDLDNISATPFADDHLIALLPKSHPFSNKSNINLSDLSVENFMFLDKNTNLYDLCYTACKKANFTPNVTYTGHRPENIIEMVRSNTGVALLMKKQATYFHQDDLSCLNLIPPVTSTIYLTHQKGAKLSNAAKLFWEHIQKTYNTL